VEVKASLLPLETFGDPCLPWNACFTCNKKDLYVCLWCSQVKTDLLRVSSYSSGYWLLGTGRGGMTWFLAQVVDQLFSLTADVNIALWVQENYQVTYGDDLMIFFFIFFLLPFLKSGASCSKINWSDFGYQIGSNLENGLFKEEVIQLYSVV